MASRREPTEAEKAPRPSLFEAGEALKMSQKGEEKRCALVSTHVNTLAEMPRPPRDATTGKRLVKEIAIWVDEGDSWSPIELGKQEHCPVLFIQEGDDDDNGNASRYAAKNFEVESGTRLETTKGRFYYARIQG